MCLAGTDSVHKKILIQNVFISIIVAIASIEEWMFQEAFSRDTYGPENYVRVLQCFCGFDNFFNTLAF